MKISPKADYPIQVIPEADERDGPDLHHFEGIYRMILNQVVQVVFVPDVSRLAPPWDDRQLPPGFDELTSPAQARLVAALLASYVVTPNDALAGSEERIAWTPAEFPDLPGAVVFYVTSDEFARFAPELAELSELVFSKWPNERVSDLRRFEVVTFLERRVVASDWLDPADAMMLGREAANSAGPPDHQPD